ncbi:hypothetical protein K4F52_003041 [Lecanicillium sp. MT-2017a]|nr:hypothetical protein K4F52_003041 [Lecanicillium sp. MT-2017a]
MSQDAEASRLLHLPAELRRSIMIAVTRHGRSRPPCLNQKLIDNRVRLRNCFGKNFPEATNLYVPRRSNPYLHGNGLRGTNRQRRREMDLLVEEELKSGKINVPFVLDVMIVKDVGVFPCWMSFPYRPQHLKVLTINLRIVHPGSAVVPDEWVEAAKYDEDFPRSNHSPALQNIMMAISLYAFGCLTRDAGRHLQSNVVDARLAASGQYVTDKLHVNFDNLEYDANGKPITLNVPDTLKQGRFYEAGYVQFGREVFGDYSTKWKDGDEIEDEAVLISEGKLACHQLESRLNAVLCSMRVSSESPRSVYLRVLARSVGELSVSGCRRRQVPILGRHPGLWVDLRYALDNETLTGRYTKAKIARDLKDEKDHGWDEMAKNLRTVQIRSHGWVNDDD